MNVDIKTKSLRSIIPHVSRETVDRLLSFESLFLKWSKAINLASPSTLADLWSRHVLDCAQLLPLAPNAQRWLDLGSGGGFPGIVIGCFLKDIPHASIDLVESAGKKAAFLRTVSGHLDLPVRVHADRIETVYSKISTPDVITARALASLTDLFGLAEPWLKAGSTALFQKGRDYQKEIDESRVRWRFDLLEHRSAVDPDSVILEISKLQRV